MYFSVEKQWFVMDVRRITINIAGRTYPLNVPSDEEETLRKVGRQIEQMIKDFEASFDVKDKQDALAMCALKLGTSAEVFRLSYDKQLKSSLSRIAEISSLIGE